MNTLVEQNIASQGYIMLLPYLSGGKGQFGKVAHFQLSSFNP
jgi:hypothetical protein